MAYEALHDLTACHHLSHLEPHILQLTLYRIKFLPLDFGNANACNILPTLFV